MRALATLTYLRAGIVVGAAAVVLAVAGYLAYGIFDRVAPFDINDPDSEVVEASRAYESVTGQTAEPGVVLLVSGSSEDAAAAARQLRSVGGIAEVTAPDSDSALISADGTRSLVLGYLDAGANRVEVGEAVDEHLGSTPGVLAGGTTVAAHQVGVRSENDTRKLELYAAPVLLLLLVFRSAVAAMLPLLVAAFSILTTFAILRLMTEITTIDLFALQTVTGLGVGLAIDYSLFILDRYRQEAQAGASSQSAHLRVLQTAGRTVAFSALTVAAALISLVVFPQPFLNSTGIAGALTALFAGLTALVVLPAFLTLLGPFVKGLAIESRPPTTSLSEASGFWRRLPQMVCRRPIPALLAAALTMLALSSQALGLDVTTPDASELPRDESARAVADGLVDFPGVPATQLFAVVPESALDGSSLPARIEAIEGVSSVAGPKRLDADRVQLLVAADLNPLSEEGEDLVADVRDRFPDGALLGGRAAEQVDQRDSILDYAPLVTAIVVITNLLLLAALTGSLVLPFLAVVMNMLTVAASFGALILAFTTDAGAALLGTEVQPGIDLSVPVIVFAVGFGLSTDYGVFLFARVREERAAAATEQDAIVEAVAKTGRLITTSAALLGIAVGAFVFSDLVIVKEFAVAIAVAVLLDATLVRALLIPALLGLLGRSAWWPGAHDSSPAARARRAR